MNICGAGFFILLFVGFFWFFGELLKANMQMADEIKKAQEGGYCLDCGRHFTEERPSEGLVCSECRAKRIAAGVGLYIFTKYH